MWSAQETEFVRKTPVTVVLKDGEAKHAMRFDVRDGSAIAVVTGHVSLR